MSREQFLSSFLFLGESSSYWALLFTTPSSEEDIFPFVLDEIYLCAESLQKFLVTAEILWHSLMLASSLF